MNRADTLTWTDEYGEGSTIAEYRGRTLRIWLFGLFFHIGIGWRA